MLNYFLAYLCLGVGNLPKKAQNGPFLQNYALLFRNQPISAETSVFFLDGHQKKGKKGAPQQQL